MRAESSEARDFYLHLVPEFEPSPSDDLHLVLLMKNPAKRLGDHPRRRHGPHLGLAGASSRRPDGGWCPHTWVLAEDRFAQDRSCESSWNSGDFERYDPDTRRVRMSLIASKRAGKSHRPACAVRLACGLVADQLAAATFEGLIGETFRVDGRGSPLELRLVGLGTLRHAPLAQAQAGFSIDFAGPCEPLLRQRSYALANERLALPMIFLVPVGPGEDGFLRYDAVGTAIIATLSALVLLSTSLRPPLRPSPPEAGPA